MHATGPRTVDGKAASSRNAVKHGLLSETPLVTSLETAEEWETHLAGVIADLAPQGQMEACLAERAGLLLWRLRRLASAEVEWIDDSLEGAEKEWRSRMGSSAFSECGEDYEDRHEFAVHCQALFEFAFGMPSADGSAPVPEYLVVAYLRAIPQRSRCPFWRRGPPRDWKA